MLFTTEDNILIKHYRLDKNIAEGKYKIQDTKLYLNSVW